MSRAITLFQEDMGLWRMNFTAGYQFVKLDPKPLIADLIEKQPHETTGDNVIFLNVLFYDLCRIEDEG